MFFYLNITLQIKIKRACNTGLKYGNTFDDVSPVDQKYLNK